PAQALQNNTDLLLSRKLPPGLPLDLFNVSLSRSFGL
ncbi:MAG: hypothetical protein ACI9NG_001144, partial [Hyphomonas sp.]